MVFACHQSFFSEKDSRIDVNTKWEVLHYVSIIWLCNCDPAATWLQDYLHHLFIRDRRVTQRPHFIISLNPCKPGVRARLSVFVWPYVMREQHNGVRVCVRACIHKRARPRTRSPTHVRSHTRAHIVFDTYSFVIIAQNYMSCSTTPWKRASSREGIIVEAPETRYQRRVHTAQSPLISQKCWLNTPQETGLFSLRCCL